MKLQPLYRDKKADVTKEVIQHGLKGSTSAQRHLFDMNYSDGLNIALRYSANPDDAKEILSNAFL